MRHDLENINEELQCSNEELETANEELRARQDGVQHFTFRGVTTQMMTASATATTLPPSPMYSVGVAVVVTDSCEVCFVALSPHRYSLPPLIAAE